MGLGSLDQETRELEKNRDIDDRFVARNEVAEPVLFRHEKSQYVQIFPNLSLKVAASSFAVDHEVPALGVRATTSTHAC